MNMPFAPIQDFMERHEIGLADLFPSEAGVPRNDDDSNRFRTAPPPAARRVRDDLRPLYELWDKRLQRARKRGHMDRFDIDDFCITILRRHPSELYGKAWFA